MKNSSGRPHTAGAGSGRSTTSSSAVGSSGSVVARRLSEDADVSVLLLEPNSAVNLAISGTGICVGPTPCQRPLDSMSMGKV